MSNKVLRINEIINFVLKEAKVKRDNAAYGGLMHDDGARLLEDQIKWFQAGVRHERFGDLPEEWKKYQELEDSEYEEFLRLKKKFAP